MIGITASLQVSAPSQQTRSSFVPSDGFCFHGGGVNLPIGKFLLVRKGDQLGALRITAITPGDQAQARGSEWIGTISYESFFAGGHKSLADKSATHLTSTLNFGRMKGFGFHYSYQSGNYKSIVGPWRIPFFYPDGIYMTSVDFWNGINHDSGLEFAATNARQVSQLDPSEPRLVWYRYDNNRDIPCPVSAPPIQTITKP
jgi:hypothetical protein